MEPPIFHSCNTPTGNTSARDVASALTLQACHTPLTSPPLQSSTCSNISSRKSPRIRTCSVLPPPTHGTTTRARPTPQGQPPCSRIVHTRNVDNIFQPSPAPRRSIAAQGRASYDRHQELRPASEDAFPCSSHLMQLGVMLTRRFFAANALLYNLLWTIFWWVANLDPALVGQKLSWIVFGTLSSRDDWPRTRIIDGNDTSAISPGG